MGENDTACRFEGASSPAFVAVVRWHGTTLQYLGKPTENDFRQMLGMKAEPPDQAHKAAEMHWGVAPWWRAVRWWLRYDRREAFKVFLNGPAAILFSLRVRRFSGWGRK